MILTPAIFSGLAGQECSWLTWHDAALNIASDQERLVNWTLKPQTNVAFCILWAAGVTAGLVFVKPAPLLLCFVPAAIGAVAGILQSQRLFHAGPEFKRAGSALEIRKLMTAAWDGRISIWLLWLNFIVVPFLGHSYQNQLLLVIMCGYFSFPLARDLVTLPAVIALARD